MSRRIKLPAILPEIIRRPRSYGYNVHPVTLPPDDGNLMALSAKQAAELHPRGNDYPQHGLASENIIDRESIGGSRDWFAADRNEIDLNGGRPPRMIRRRTRALNAGAIWFGTGVGVGTTADSVDPKTDGGSLYIPHQRIPRTPITVTAFRRTVDNTSTIPARGIAAPVKVIGS